jgi:hypothetical protein
VTPVSPSERDHDGDGILDICDNCPTVANPEQKNTDRFGDACVAPGVNIAATGMIAADPVIDRGTQIGRGV